MTFPKLFITSNLLPDTKATEDLAEQFLGIDSSGDLADGFHGIAKLDGNKLGALAILQGVFCCF